MVPDTDSTAVVSPTKLSDVSIGQYQVYRDSRTDDEYKVVYHDDDDDFILCKYQGDPEAIGGSLHYQGPKSQFRRQVAAGRWKLVTDPHQ